MVPMTRSRLSTVRRGISIGRLRQRRDLSVDEPYLVPSPFFSAASDDPEQYSIGRAPAYRADNYLGAVRRGSGTRYLKMTYYERQIRATANAQNEQKDKSEYVAELADHLDVDTNTLKAALSDVTLAVVKALAVELGPDGEPTGNADDPAMYPDGTISGRNSGPDVSREDVEAARKRVTALVANSDESSDDFEEKTIGEMSEDELHKVLDRLEERMVTWEDVEERLNGETSPSANEAGGVDEDVSEYPDGTIGSSVGSSEPTGNASTQQRDTGSDDPSDYSDGTIGGEL